MPRSAMLVSAPEESQVSARQARNPQREGAPARTGLRPSPGFCLSACTAPRYRLHPVTPWTWRGQGAVSRFVTAVCPLPTASYHAADSVPVPGRQQAPGRNGPTLRTASGCTSTPSPLGQILNTAHSATV
jgi:hypothetical protein